VLTVLRRLALLVTLPVGSDVLGSHLMQGFITRSVSNYLNLAGVVCLVVWSLDLVVERDSTAGRRFRWFLWSLLLLTLCFLAWLHLRLDELLDPETFSIFDRVRYRLLHRWYLWVSTLQWAGSLLLAAWTLHVWRRGDQAVR
jgi:hypothetical protein